MTRQEFETLAGVQVTPKEYDVIQLVYMFHPCISNRTGKQEIVVLYKMGGMRFMFDLLPTAQKAQKLENEYREAYSKMQVAQTALDELKSGVTGWRDKNNGNA